SRTCLHRAAGGRRGVAGGDELADWITAQPASFRLPARPEDQLALQVVSQWAAGAGYHQAAVATFLQVGDYFLVAQALSLGFTVVTQEAPDPVVSKKRIKIPDACKAVGVSWTTPFAMLRREGARFVL